MRMKLSICIVALLGISGTAFGEIISGDDYWDGDVYGISGTIGMPWASSCASYSDSDDPFSWAWADAEEILILVGNADCGWEFNYYAYAEGDIRTISGEEVLILADAVASVTDPLRVERGGAARVDETLSDGSGFHDFAAPVDSDTVMVGSVMLNSGARITGAHTIVTLTTAGGDFDRGHAHADAKAGVDFWINLP